MRRALRFQLDDRSVVREWAGPVAPDTSKSSRAAERRAGLKRGRDIGDGGLGKRLEIGRDKAHDGAIDRHHAKAPSC
jgi:hypothetical protein